MLWGVGKGVARCGEVWESALGCGDVGKCWLLGRCGKVCWDVEEVWGDVGKCWERCEKTCWGVGEMWGEVLKKVCWGFP